jgi:hypothetical protein
MPPGINKSFPRNFAKQLHRGYGLCWRFIGGAGCITHGDKNRNDVDKYGQEALEKTIKDAVSIVKMS